MQAAVQPAPAPLAPPQQKPRLHVWVAAALVPWLLTSVYLVSTQQQAVVTRFGAVVEPRVLPGIHIALPWPIDRVTRLKVQQLQRLVVGGDAADAILGRSQPLRSQFLTGDQNIINLRVVVQYSVGSPVDYLFRTGNVAHRLLTPRDRASRSSFHPWPANEPDSTVTNTGSALRKRQLATCESS